MQPAKTPAPHGLDHPLISNGNLSLTDKLPNMLLRHRLEQLGSTFICHCYNMLLRQRFEKLRSTFICHCLEAVPPAPDTPPLNTTISAETHSQTLDQEITTITLKITEEETPVATTAMICCNAPTRAPTSRQMTLANSENGQR